MLKQRVDAIFEDGILKPVARIDLAEGDRVTIFICDVGDLEAEDESDYIPLAAEDGGPRYHLGGGPRSDKSIPGSLADDIIRDREDRC